jgi:ATP-dependent DNA helicase RecQ
LPALAKAENSGFLTLVISPLQSLMEDQVSNLKYSYHKTNVGALHSALDPLTKKEVCDKVEH